MPHHHPAFAILDMASKGADAMGRLPEGDLPAIIQRWVVALRALGPAEDLGQPVAMGAWCAKVPMWGNPFTGLKQSPDPLEDDNVPPAWRVGELNGWASMQPIERLGTVGGIREVVQEVSDPLRGSLHLGEFLKLQAALPDRDGGVVLNYMASWPVFHHLIVGIWKALPPPWRTPWQLAGDPETHVTQAGVVAMLCSRLGWKAGNILEGGLVLPLQHDWKVKYITPMFLTTLGRQRSDRWRLFIEDSLDDSNEGVIDLEVLRLRKCFLTLWKLRWDNHYKEPWWRLTVQGVRGAGGHDLCMGGCVLVAGRPRLGIRRRQGHGLPGCTIFGNAQ